MHRYLLCAAVCAAAFCAPLAARAQDPELTKIREEIRQLKEAYEKRIEALEKRLQETEARAGKAEETATQATAQASSRPAREGAFNPAVSLILNGTLSSLKRDPGTFRINGFVPTMGEVAPPRRGFSL